MKHGKYSKTKEVKPYKITVTTVRYDGITKDYYYSRTYEGAELKVALLKELDPKPNDYYFGSMYLIEYIGSDKLI